MHLIMRIYYTAESFRGVVNAGNFIEERPSPNSPVSSTKSKPVISIGVFEAIKILLPSTTPIVGIMSYKLYSRNLLHLQITELSD